MTQLDRQARLASTLQELADQGRFEAVVLVDREGLPLAAETSAHSAETVAAMVTLVKGLVDRSQGELGLGAVDQLSIVAEDRVQLVCRYFWAGDQELTLALIAPPSQSYRRLTNKAIREIKEVL